MAGLASAEELAGNGEIATQSNNAFEASTRLSRESNSCSDSLRADLGRPVQGANENASSPDPAQRRSNLESELKELRLPGWVCPTDERHAEAWLARAYAMTELARLVNSYGRAVDYLNNHCGDFRSDALKKLPEGWSVGRNEKTGELSLRPDLPLEARATPANERKIDKMINWLAEYSPDVDNALKHFSLGSSSYLQYGDEKASGQIVLQGAHDGVSGPASLSTICVLDRFGRLNAVSNGKRVVYTNDWHQLIDEKGDPLQVRDNTVVGVDGATAGLKVAGRFCDEQGQRTTVPYQRDEARDYDLITHKYIAERERDEKGNVLPNGNIIVAVTHEYKRTGWLPYGLTTDTVAAIAERRVYKPDDFVPLVGGGGNVAPVRASELVGFATNFSNILKHDAIKWSEPMIDAGMLSSGMAGARAGWAGLKTAWSAGKLGLGLTRLAGMAYGCTELAVGASGTLVPFVEHSGGQVGKSLLAARNNAITAILMTQLPGVQKRFSGMLFGEGTSALANTAARFMLPSLAPFGYEQGEQCAENIRWWIRGKATADSMLTKALTNIDKVGLLRAKYSPLLEEAGTRDSAPSKDKAEPDDSDNTEQDDPVRQRLTGKFFDSKNDEEVVAAGRRLISLSVRPDGTLPDILGTRVSSDRTFTLGAENSLNVLINPSSLPPEFSLAGEVATKNFNHQATRSLPELFLLERLTFRNLIQRLERIAVSSNSPVARLLSARTLYQIGAQTPQGYAGACQDTLNSTDSDTHLRLVAVADLARLAGQAREYESRISQDKLAQANYDRTTYGLTADDLEQSLRQTAERDVDPAVRAAAAKFLQKRTHLTGS